VRSEHAYDVDLAERELICQLRAQLARQIRHLVERVCSLFVKPIRDLSGPVRGLAKFVKLFLKLVKQERFYLDLVGSNHRKAYWTAELASNLPVIRFVPVMKRFVLPAVSFLAIAFLIFACASPSEVMTEQPSSRSAPVPGERLPDEGSVTPGSGGSSAKIGW
jgi:hypothetical protein